MIVAGYSTPMHELKAPCPCGNWVFKLVHLVSAPGYSAVKEHCRKCHNDYLLVFATDRGTRFVAAVRILGKSAESMRRALRNVRELRDQDIESMLASPAIAAGG